MCFPTPPLLRARVHPCGWHQGNPCRRRGQHGPGASPGRRKGRQHGGAGQRDDFNLRAPAPGCAPCVLTGERAGEDLSAGAECSPSPRRRRENKAASDPEATLGLIRSPPPRLSPVTILRARSWGQSKGGGASDGWTFSATWMKSILLTLKKQNKDLPEPLRGASLYSVHGATQSHR